MAHMIIAGLRPHIGRSAGLGPQDSGNDGDAEEDYPTLGTRRRSAPKRRSPHESELSVSSNCIIFSSGLTPNQRKIRQYMGNFVKGDEGIATEQEVNAFNPDLGPCCDIGTFRVHLEGTPCNPWNKSAIDVFVAGFLATHPEYRRRDESVQKTVKLKSRSALESMIRKHRRSKIILTKQQEDGYRLRKNRQERKRKVGCSLSHSIRRK